MKGGFSFYQDQKLRKKINSERLLLSVWFHYFFQLHFSKPYLMSAPKIVEVTFAIY